MSALIMVSIDYEIDYRNYERYDECEEVNSIELRIISLSLSILAIVF